MRNILLLLTAILAVAVGYGAFKYFHADDVVRDTLVACEGETVSVLDKAGSTSGVLIYSVSPADGSALFRYLDSERRVQAMREIRMDHVTIRTLPNRVQVYGTVTSFDGPGLIPPADPFLLQVHKGSRMLVELRLFRGRVWAVQLGAVDLGYCVMSN